MSDTSENATPKAPDDEELVRMMLVGGITTEQPSELGVPVDTADSTESEADTK
ncbi:hypothetical protein [Streptomyces sp. NPDC090135]|uniref:hypothetical protein n=1 Tax=Streptomyces sp. NPDC090135 TaxID=3365957 RepID=UPI00380CECE3